MSKVKEILNKSKVAVPIQVKNETTYLLPGQKLEKVNVQNLDDIRGKCRVVEDLTEVGSKKKTVKEKLDG